MLICQTTRADHHGLFTALYLLYAKLEEEHGLARHAMNIYDRAAMGVEKEEQNEVRRRGKLTVALMTTKINFGLSKYVANS